MTAKLKVVSLWCHNKGLVLNNNKKKYGSVFITIKISSESNQLLTQAAEKSGRTKKAELRLRVDSNLKYIESIVDIDTFWARSCNKHSKISGNY